MPPCPRTRRGTISRIHISSNFEEISQSGLQVFLTFLSQVLNNQIDFGFGSKSGELYDVSVLSKWIVASQVHATAEKQPGKTHVSPRSFRSSACSFLTATAT